MLQNAFLLAKIGADTAENERNFAEICQKFATTLRVPTEPKSLEVAGKEQILRYFSHSAVLDCPLPVGLYYVTARIRDRLGQTAET